MGTLHSGSIAQLEAGLAAWVREVKAGDPLVPLTIVVGSSPLRYHLSRVLARHLGAHANLRLVTIHRFATELAEEGGERRPQLSPLARRRLAAQVVTAVAAERPGWYFARVQQAPGLARAFARTLDDLRQAAVPADGWPLPSDQSTADKLAAVKHVYRRYVEELAERGLLDDAALYRAAAAAASGQTEWRHGPIAVYGIYDLTGAQRLFLASLHERAPLAAFVPAAAGSGAPPAAYAEPARRFFAGLGLRRAAAVAENPAPQIRILSAADDEAEGREAVRELLVAAAGGAGWYDMALVAPSDERADELARALVTAGLPVARRLPAAGGAAHRLRCLLACVTPAAGQPFARQAVIDLAAALSSSTDASVAAEVARWNHESYEAAVVGGDDWNDRLRRHRARLAWRLERALEGPSDDADDDWEAEAASLRVSLAATESLLAFARRLIVAAAALPERAPWTEMVRALRELAAAQAMAADAADDAVRTLSALAQVGLVEDEVARADALTCAREALQALRLQEGSVQRLGVAVLTPHQLRGLRFHTVVFTGLTEAGFPQRPRQDPLLLDDDRRLLATAFGVRLERAAEREHEAALLFGLAADAARTRLVLTTSRAEPGSGRPRLPSRPLLEVLERITGRPIPAEALASAELLPGVYIRVAKGPPGPASIEHQRPAASLRDLDLALLAELAGAGGQVGSTAARAYLTAVCGAAAASRIVERRRAAAAAHITPWDGLLGSAACRTALASLGPFTGPVSATAVQTYLGCPFRYYMRYVLGLSPPAEPESVQEMAPNDLGVLAHAVLRRVFGNLQPAAGAAQALERLEDAVERECLRAERDGLTGLPTVWAVQRRRLAADLRQAVLRDPVFDTTASQRPWAVEARFGDPGSAPVALELGGGVAVAFRGRIDRVDRDADGARARVIDYKTGGGRAEREQLKAGRDVQLPVYLLAAEALLAAAGESPPETTCEYRSITRRGGFAVQSLPEGRQQALADLRRTVAGVRRLVLEGVFARSLPDPDKTCASCDIAYACAEIGWAKKAKRVAPELRALARLQGPVARDEDDASAG